jgi:hypothetical protein
MVMNMSPKYLYKYLPLDNIEKKDSNLLLRLADLLINKRVFLGHALKQNDPNECRSNIKLDLSKEKIKQITPHITNEQSAALEKIRPWMEAPVRGMAENLPKNSRLLCLCAKNNIVEMWKEYANNHFGVCVEFYVTKDSWFSHAEPINYLDDHPPVVDGGNQNNPHIGFCKQVDRWSYEDEYRIVFEDESHLGQEYEYMPFTEKNLNGIIFGTKALLIYKEIIKKILEKAGGNIIYYQTNFDGEDIKILQQEF